MRSLYLLVLAGFFAATAIADEAATDAAETEAVSTDVVNEEGRVHIVWQSPEDFTDIVPANSPKKPFRTRVFKQLDKYLEKISKDFPDGQVLKLVVTDVDLAGQVWRGGMVPLVGGSIMNFGNAGNDIRVVNRGDIPRISFSYQLLSPQGVVLLEGEEKLRDLAFDTRLNFLRRRDDLRHEKWMLKMWFDETLDKKEAETLSAING